MHCQASQARPVTIHLGFENDCDQTKEDFLYAILSLVGTLKRVLLSF